MSFDSLSQANKLKVLEKIASKSEAASMLSNISYDNLCPAKKAKIDQAKQDLGL